MLKVSFKALVAIAPLITALAALAAAILGEDGISSLLKLSQSDDDQQQSTPKVIPNSVAFYCDESIGGLSTTVSNSSKDQPIAVINWDINNDYFGDNWPPQKRCQVVSERFQAVHERDQLAYLTADMANWLEGQDIFVVCGVKQQGASCQESDLLFTLQTGDDPNEILGDLIAIRQAPSTNKPLLRGENSSFKDGLRVYYELKEIVASSTQPPNKDTENPAF